MRLDTNTGIYLGKSTYFFTGRFFTLYPGSRKPAMLSRGAILEVWEDGVFEVELVGSDGQNIAYDRRNTYTIYIKDISFYSDPLSIPIRS